MKNWNIKIEYYIILFLILTIFFLSLTQQNSQHWSAHFDSDWFNIYNILLLNSGYQQEFYDHPALSLYLISSTVLKFYDFFNSNLNFQIDSINDVKNLDLYFAKIFSIARYINAIVHCLCVFFLYLILNKFRCEKIFNIMILFTLTFSNFFLINLFQIRPEIYSVLFFLISLFFLLHYFENNKKIYFLLLSGFCAGFAYISKIQILFFLGFLVLIIPHIPFILKKNYNDKFNTTVAHENIKFYNILFYSYLLMSLLYVLIEIFIIYEHPRYINHPKIDLYIFLIFNIFYFIYLKFLSANSYYSYKDNFSIYVIFLIGFLISIFFLIFVNWIDLFAINHNIYFKYLNPFYFLTTRAPLDLETIKLFDLREFFLSRYIYILVFISILPFCRKILNRDYFFLLITAGLLILYIVSNFFRYFELYEIYSFTALILLFAVSKDNKVFKLRLTIILLIMLSNLYFTFIKNDFTNYFNRESVFKDCSTSNWFLLKGINGFKEWTPWTPKFNKKFYQRLCKDTNS